MDLAGRLNELGLQQMQLVAELNRDAFERSKFDTQMAYDRERDIIEDAREQAIFDENVRQFGLQFAEDQRQFNLTNSRLSGDGTGDTSGLPKGFVSAAEDARNDLLSGQEWGAVWNRIKAQFPNVANDTIDTFLQGRAGTSRELVASMLDDGTGVQQEPYMFGEDRPAEGLANPDNIPSDLQSIEASENRSVRAQIQEWWNTGYSPDQISELIVGTFGVDPTDYGFPEVL